MALAAYPMRVLQVLQDETLIRLPGMATTDTYSHLPKEACIQLLINSQFDALILLAYLAYTQGQRNSKEPSGIAVASGYFSLYPILFPHLSRCFSL